MLKAERKQLQVGRPKKVRSLVIDANSPDNYPTLIRYLEATGRIKHTTYAVMMKARSLYLRNVNVAEIAIELKLEPAVIDRWALCFSWDEERDRRVFEQFRKMRGAEKLYGEDVGKRHDRIAGSIEQVAERMLQQHANGNTVLSPRDVNTLASTIKSTQEIRRTSRGENIKKNEDTKNVNVTISVPGVMEKVANALVDAYDRPKLIQAKTRTIALGVEESIGRDTEFETIDRDSEARAEEEGSD